VISADSILCDLNAAINALTIWWIASAKGPQSLRRPNPVRRNIDGCSAAADARLFPFGAV
jgi:hypothetical protein